MTIADFIRFIQPLSAAERDFLSEVSTLAKLMLLAPATNAVCERPFSSLKRLKIYLRSTLEDHRLFHLIVLHVHRQLTDSLGLTQVAKQFVANNDRFKQVLGTFSKPDMPVKKIFVKNNCLVKIIFCHYP